LSLDEDAMADCKDVSDGELAVLEALWAHGPLPIRKVADQLFPGGSTVHYATVQKQLERLEAKGHVLRDRTLHVHLFSATIRREELIRRRVRAVVDKLCGGSLVPLLSHLAHARELTSAERMALRQLVEKRVGKPETK
jgi:predicted transcriptional regulator